MTTTDLNRIFALVLGMAIMLCIVHLIYLGVVLAAEPRVLPWILIAQAPSFGIVVIGVVFHVIMGHRGSRLHRWCARMIALAFTIMLACLPSILRHEIGPVSTTLAIGAAIALQDNRTAFWTPIHAWAIVPIILLLMNGQIPMIWWTPLEAIMVALYTLGVVGVAKKLR